MKILSVVAGFLINDSYGYRVRSIARILQSKGHDVHIVQYGKESTYKRLKGDLLNMGNISNSIVIVYKATVHIKHLRELWRDNYDVVYGNAPSATFCSMLGRLGKPLILDMHGGLVEEFLLTNEHKWGWRNPSKLLEFLLVRIIEFVSLSFSSKIICVSNKMIQYLHTKKKIPLEKIVYVTNGVDLDFFKSVDSECAQILKEQLGLKDEFVFGYIGGFAKWQGVENFISAAEKINDKNVAFVIVGGERKLKKGNLLFIPKVPQSQIPNYYSICDVLVLPRPNHPATEMAAPTKFAEYTAMGKPILTTNVGDACEFTKKYNCGVVIPNNAPETLINGILQFRNKSKDELKIMSRNSRRLAENEFDWDKVGVNLLKAVEIFQ